MSGHVAFDLLQINRKRFARQRICGLLRDSDFTRQALGAFAVCLCAAAIVFFGVVFLPFGQALAGTVLGIGLLALTIFDIRHFLLPNFLTGGLFVAGLGFTLWLDPGAVLVRGLSGIAGFAIVAGAAVLYRHWRGRDGLGGGDAKLVGVAGVWLGPAAIGPLLFLSAVLALFMLLLGGLFGRSVDRNTVVPFGAFLCPVLFALWCAQSFVP